MAASTSEPGPSEFTHEGGKTRSMGIIRMSAVDKALESSVTIEGGKQSYHLAITAQKQSFGC
jgi:hypothetical protein